MKHSVQASTQWSIACAVGYLLALGVLVSSVDVGYAVTTAYTDKTAFELVLPTPNGTLNFDSMMPGPGDISGATLTVPGIGGVGITFPSSIPDVLGGPDPLHLHIVANIGNSNPTTSGFNSLGTDDDGNFNTIIAKNDLTFTFTSPVLAFGLSIITPDVMFDDDIRLNFGMATAMLDADIKTLVAEFPLQRVRYDAYFLGVIADTPFLSATLTYGPLVPDGGVFFFNADDFRVAVPAPTQIPEPGTLVLLGLGIVGIACWKWRCTGRFLG